MLLSVKQEASIQILPQQMVLSVKMMKASLLSWFLLIL